MKFRKIILIPLVLLFCIAIGLYIRNTAPTTNYPANPTGSEPSPEGSLAFSVLGDVHGDTAKLDKDIRALYDIDPKMDAMVLNGDAVDAGIKSEYDSVNQCINKDRQYIPKVLIRNIGNHEFYDYKLKTNTAEDVQTFINRYLEFSGEKKVYHDIWIKGFHFISLGSEEDNTAKVGATRAFISDSQLKWLEDTLADGYKKGRPIFVFMHQNLATTKQGWGGTEQSAEINKILSKYPEVILFTSHTHGALENNMPKLNQPFTMVHTGAVFYTLTFDDKGNRNRIDDNQGIYVTVQGKKVVIKGRDFKSESWVFSQELSYQ